MASAATRSDMARVEIFPAISRDVDGNVLATQETVVIDIVPRGRDFSVRLRSLSTPEGMLKNTANEIRASDV
jgi:hypothetical protein